MSVSNQLSPHFLNYFFKGRSRHLVSHLIEDEKATNNTILTLIPISKKHRLHDGAHNGVGYPAAFFPTRHPPFLPLS
jgi:hypothetical protein